MFRVLFKNWGLFFAILVFAFASAESLAQNNQIGQIFTKNDADVRFGSVISSVSIPTNDLNSVLVNTVNFAMFKIINGSLFILGDKRVVLSPPGGSVPDEMVLHLFSKSKVIELLSLGNSGYTVVENRQNVLTVTNGDYTLEVSMPCPPFCFTEE